MPARLARTPLALIAGGIGFSVAGRALWRRLRLIDLHGQVVVITGASRGLGFVLAQEFARKGACLVMCARQERDLERAREAIADLGAEVLAIPCDVSDRLQAQRLIEQATARFGRVDVLVNNAGTMTVGPFELQTLADFQEAMAVMFWSGVYTALAVLPQMQHRKSGRIVNITSIGGKISVPHLLPYGAAKFAAVGFSEGLHAELAKDGIKVVTVVPGLMRTGSPVNALFKGRHRDEYSWFSLSDSLPGISLSARWAARHIVQATRRGDAEVILGLQAQLVARLQGLFPGSLASILGVVNRFLPASGGVGQERRFGRESETRVTQSFLMKLGQRAAQQYQQQLETITKE